MGFKNSAIDGFPLFLDPLQRDSTVLSKAHSIEAEQRILQSWRVFVSGLSVNEQYLAYCFIYRSIGPIT